MVLLVLFLACIQDNTKVILGKKNVHFSGKDEFPMSAPFSYPLENMSVESLLSPVFLLEKTAGKYTHPTASYANGSLRVGDGLQFGN